jgi:flagellar basal body rod protein FlgG
MIKALAVSGQAMLVQQRRHELIANNLANANTAGFQKLVSRVEQSAVAGAAPGAARARGLSVSALTSTAQGPLESTGNPLDVALMGEGYFVVETPAGPRLSRDGGFSLGPDGELLHASGYPVQGDGGALRVEGTPSILPDGTVMDGERASGRLSILRPVAGSPLLRRGDNLLEAPGGTEEVPPEAVSVQAGRREASNVEVVEEMVAMIRAFRSYEMAQKAAQAADELLRVAVERVGVLRA